MRHFGFVGGSCGTTNEGPFIGPIPCKNFVMTGIAVLKLFDVLSFTLESRIPETKISDHFFRGGGEFDC